MNKKGRIIIIALIAIFLVAGWSARETLAYTFTQTTTLDDGMGGNRADVTVGVWSASDTNSPLYGTGYWGYEYEVTNVDFNAHITVFGVAASGEEWKTPANWSYAQGVGIYEWTAAEYHELAQGQTQGGFGVKSNQYYYGDATGYVKDTSPPISVGTTWGPTNLIPEPSSIILLLSGTLGLIIPRFRRN